MVAFSLIAHRRLAVNHIDDYLESVPLYADFNRRYLQLDWTATWNAAVRCAGFDGFQLAT